VVIIRRVVIFLEKFISIFCCVSANTSVAAGDVKTDLLVVALSSEYEGFYRARIVDAIEGGAKVFFIDYGNTEDVSTFFQ